MLKDYPIDALQPGQDQTHIRLEMVEDLANEVRSRIDRVFPECTWLEAFALGSLAKGCQTALSASMLFRTRAVEDAATLTRVLAEGLVHFCWVADKEATRGVRLHLNLLNDETTAYKLAAHLVENGPDEHKDVLRAKVERHSKNIIEVTSVLETQFGVTGKQLKKPSLKDKMVELGIENFYGLQYASLSSSTHSDGLSISQYLEHTPEGTLVHIDGSDENIDHFLSTLHRSLLDLVGKASVHCSNILPGIGPLLSYQQSCVSRLDSMEGMVVAPE